VNQVPYAALRFSARLNDERTELARTHARSHQLARNYQCSTPTMVFKVALEEIRDVMVSQWESEKMCVKCLKRLGKRR